MPRSTKKLAETNSQLRLAVLLLIVYPLALVAAFLYALLSPLSLIDCCKPLIEMIRNMLELPLRCARNMAQAKQLIIM